MNYDKDLSIRCFVCRSGKLGPKPMGLYHTLEVLQCYGCQTDFERGTKKFNSNLKKHQRFVFWNDQMQMSKIGPALVGGMIGILGSNFTLIVDTISKGLSYIF